jgi:hypothetical protein
MAIWMVPTWKKQKAENVLKIFYSRIASTYMDGKNKFNLFLIRFN